MLHLDLGWQEKATMQRRTTALPKNHCFCFPIILIPVFVLLNHFPFFFVSLLCLHVMSLLVTFCFCLLLFFYNDHMCLFWGFFCSFNYLFQFNCSALNDSNALYTSYILCVLDHIHKCDLKHFLIVILVQKVDNKKPN